MNSENGIFGLRARIFFVLLMCFSHVTHSESIMVGDIEINPQDFSANLDLEQRIAKCLSCHGHQAGGDGQTIARQGISQQGVPACINCHGPLGEGSATGPRLAGQNVMYIQGQFKAFASGSRQTAQSALMQPAVAGLSDDDIKAVAHYYETVVD